MRSNADSSKVDVRQRVATPVFRWIGPLVRLLLRRGLGEPNVLLTVRGRRSGEPRTTPVAMFELGDRRFVEAAFGEGDWVRNLRASGEAVIRRGLWSQAVRAVELPPETAGKLLHDTLAGFSRRRLLRSLLGPSVRPPAAILYRYRLRIDDQLGDYVSHARRCPLFELFPSEEAAKATGA
jgi:deazaflavin-dependent oxidoreductase (nitroreductase family)